jgi:hypothetical protein
VAARMLQLLIGQGDDGMQRIAGVGAHDDAICAFMRTLIRAGKT